jgi:4-oxalocrotonate tautomerase
MPAGTAASAAMNCSPRTPTSEPIQSWIGRAIFRRRQETMPFANFKVPAGTITTEQKKLIVERTTDLYAEIYGDRARPTTVVLVDEVIDGGWGVGGNVLTAAMLNGDA